MDLRVKDNNHAPAKIYRNGIEINPLTGLYFSHAFFEKADEYLHQVEPDTHCMVAVDLEHFRLFNKIYGRGQGDLLLQKLGDILKEYRRQNGGVIGYIGGDNFAMLTKYDKRELRQLSRDMGREITSWSSNPKFMSIIFATRFYFIQQLK